MTHLAARAAAGLCLAVALAAPLMAAQANGPWPLLDVRVEGLSRYSASDVIRLSGLKPGAPVTLEQVQQSANQLMQTGLFRNLAFSYSTTAAGLTLTLKVVEAVWNVPVVFDNIIWMSDAEFGAELAKEVPGFAGMAAEQGRANDFIAAAAERVLADRGIRGRVEIQPRVDVRTGATTYALTARDTGTSMRVCEFRIPGASAISERTLLDLGEGFTNADYSKATLTAFAAGTLQQVYRERGHWAVRFDPPVTTPVSGRCDGLAVTMAVTEGAAYAFGGTRWTGVSALETARLDRALDLRLGATADIRHLENGLRAVERLYHQQGYLTASPAARPEFDNSTQRVIFTIAVTEGPQFRMGALTTTKLTERQARDVSGRWRIKPGEVFDGVYYREFVTRETERLGGALKADATLDAPSATVNVTLAGL
jgi:outer membrane protein assembly factor BamA